MKPIEHVLLHPICVLYHLMCACEHCNVVFCIILNTLKLLMNLLFQKPRFNEFIISKIPDLTRFFITKPRHPGRLIKADQGRKNPQWEPCKGIRKGGLELKPPFSLIFYKNFIFFRYPNLER